uniref:Uncharacterized protein n=1 Tax=Salix viminalis TaxID=40686 RepID=A0A6N2LQ22_SALVM
MVCGLFVSGDFDLRFKVVVDSVIVLQFVVDEPEVLDSFQDAEFWFAEQGSMSSNSTRSGSFRRVITQRKRIEKMKLAMKTKEDRKQWRSEGGGEKEQKDVGSWIVDHLIIKWKNPKVDGVLPPGSMGWPLIGETLQLIAPGRSLDLHPFVKKRMQKYIVWELPVIVSTDNEINKYIFQHEGTLVELWYLDSFAKFFALEGETRVNAIGRVHRYMRGITLNHFGVESLKESLLPKIEDLLHANLSKCMGYSRSC